MPTVRHATAARALGAAAVPVLVALATGCSQSAEAEACDIAFENHDLAVDALLSAEAELNDDLEPFLDDLDILADYRDDLDYAADISGGDISALTLERADAVDDILYSIEALDDVLFDEAVRDLDANTTRLQDACGGY